ncbi:MAG: DNA/RNA nuclease SfsA [Pseudomonadota bacterium]
MKFNGPLTPARLIKRYKRFLADVEILSGVDSGKKLTAHCPNPGALMGLGVPGATVWLSHSDNPKRKLAYTYELEEVEREGEQFLVGVNTMRPNTIAEEAIRDNFIPELGQIQTLLREQRYGKNSRIDLLHVDEATGSKTFIEIKNVHLVRRGKHLEFPDCVTARGAKHLDELSDVVRQGDRAAMVFVSQWPGAETIGVARDLDPAYGEAMDRAVDAGVEVYGLSCRVDTEAIEAEYRLTFVNP